LNEKITQDASLARSPL